MPSRLLAILVAVLSALVWASGVRAASTSRIAPDFTLFDQNRHAFTLSHYRGHPIVLFFGYTHCPDVCPTILANLKRAREVVDSKAHDVLVALITVDPERDNATALRRFVTLFDPSFLGLTGTGAELKPVYRAYHVKFAKQIGSSSSYSVSHSTFVYYIGRDGGLRGYGTWDDPQNILEEDLREIVSTHR